MDPLEIDVMVQRLYDYLFDLEEEIEKPIPDFSNMDYTCRKIKADI